MLKCGIQDIMECFNTENQTNTWQLLGVIVMVLVAKIALQNGRLSQIILALFKCFNLHDLNYYDS